MLNSQVTTGKKNGTHIKNSLLVDLRRHHFLRENYIHYSPKLLIMSVFQVIINPHSYASFLTLIALEIDFIGKLEKTNGYLSTS